MVLLYKAGREAEWGLVNPFLKVRCFSDEVNALLHVLTQFHQVAAGEQLQQQYEGFLALIQRVIPLVWVQEESSNMNSVCNLVSMWLGSSLTLPFTSVCTIASLKQ